MISGYLYKNQSIKEIASSHTSTVREERVMYVPTHSLFDKTIVLTMILQKQKQYSITFTKSHWETHCDFAKAT